MRGRTDRRIVAKQRGKWKNAPYYREPESCRCGAQSPITDHKKTVKTVDVIVCKIHMLHVALSMSNVEFSKLHRISMIYYTGVK